MDGYVSGASELGGVELENARSSLCSATLGAWESKSGALQDSFQSWWYLGGQEEQAGAAGAARGTAAAYRRGFMARVEAVTKRDVERAMATYLAPLFDPSRSAFACAAPLAEHGATARALGLKSAAACVLSSSEADANRVLSVAEKDLAALFPLAEEEKEGEGKAGAAVKEEAEAGGFEEGPWPVGKQPFWRTHRGLVASVGLASAAGFAFLLGTAAVRVARSRRSP